MRIPRSPLFMLALAAAGCTGKGDPTERRESISVPDPFGTPIAVDLLIHEMTDLTTRADARALDRDYRVTLTFNEAFVDEEYEMVEVATGDSLYMHQWAEGTAWRVVFHAEGQRYEFRNREEVETFDYAGHAGIGRLASLLGVIATLRETMLGADIHSDQAAFAAAECQCEAAFPWPIPIIAACITAGGAIIVGGCAACAGTESHCGGAGCVGDTFYACPCTGSSYCNKCTSSCEGECNGPAGPLGPCNP